MEHSTASVSSTASGDVTPSTWTSDVQLYVVVVLLLVFCVLGVAGNVVVLAVFCRSGDHLASTVFIVVLAAVDFITCLAVVPFTVYIELAHYNVGVDFLCKLYQVSYPPPLHTRIVNIAKSKIVIGAYAVENESLSNELFVVVNING